jgi:hypothetical protein
LWDRLAPPWSRGTAMPGSLPPCADPIGCLRDRILRSAPWPPAYSPTFLRHMPRRGVHNPWGTAHNSRVGSHSPRGTAYSAAGGNHNPREGAHKKLPLSHSPRFTDEAPRGGCVPDDGDCVRDREGNVREGIAGGVEPLPSSVDMFVSVPDAGANVQPAGGVPPQALPDVRGSGAYVRGTDANAVGTVPRVRIAQGSIRDRLAADRGRTGFLQGLYGDESAAGPCPRLPMRGAALQLAAHGAQGHRGA